MMASALEELYKRYDSREFVEPDPLHFLFDYDDIRDREIAGLISSSLAFGNVRQIMGSVARILDLTGKSPSRYLEQADRPRIEKDIGIFRHRWADQDAMINLLDGMASAMRKFGSLEKCFASGYSDRDSDVVPALTAFVDEIIGKGKVNRLLPSPSRGSACKRLNLYLRWMVRSDGVDPGGWEMISASKLIVPLDVHMHRFAILLGMTSRRQADLKTAREITGEMKKFAPDDPVKYDFALTRLGIRRDDDREGLLRRFGITIDDYGKIGGARSAGARRVGVN
ncbi:MAG: TIGR02757 family protein [Candidatus Krumholzibacteriota bacterium]|nr:TIGR02757 family protein [Candidatus Krumholzibacteriota bacterium]